VHIKSLHIIIMSHKNRPPKSGMVISSNRNRFSQCFANFADGKFVKSPIKRLLQGRSAVCLSCPSQEAHGERMWRLVISSLWPLYFAAAVFLSRTLSSEVRNETQTILCHIFKSEKDVKMVVQNWRPFPLNVVQKLSIFRGFTTTSRH